MNAQFQRIARRDKKAFLGEQCREIEENDRMGKTRDLFKKTGDIKRTFHARMGMIKDRNGKDLTEAEEILKDGKKTQRDYEKVLMTQIITMMWPLTESQTAWRVMSSGPWEASLRTKLVEVMEFQLCCFKY